MKPTMKKPSLPIWAKKWKKDLQNILNDGIITPKLRYAIEETIKALKDQNWNLAYQLSKVKSYVVGNINPKDRDHAFQENHDKNEKILGNSVYCILDGIHHDIAFAIDEIPSGRMVVRGGKIHEMKSKGTHPIVRRIKYEHRQIEKNAKKQDEERKWEVHDHMKKVNLYG